MELADALWNSPVEIRPTNRRLSGGEWYDPDSVAFNQPTEGLASTIGTASTLTRVRGTRRLEIAAAPRRLGPSRP